MTDSETETSEESWGVLVLCAVICFLALTAAIFVMGTTASEQARDSVSMETTHQDGERVAVLTIEKVEDDVAQINVIGSNEAKVIYRADYESGMDVVVPIPEGGGVVRVVTEKRIARQYGYEYDNETIFTETVGPAS